MYIEGKACWLNHLVAALEKYNNRVHRPKLFLDINKSMEDIKINLKFLEDIKKTVRKEKKSFRRCQPR